MWNSDTELSGSEFALCTELGGKVNINSLTVLFISKFHVFPPKLSQYATHMTFP